MATGVIFLLISPIPPWLSWLINFMFVLESEKKAHIFPSSVVLHSTSSTSSIIYLERVTPVSVVCRVVLALRNKQTEAAGTQTGKKASTLWCSADSQMRKLIKHQPAVMKAELRRCSINAHTCIDTWEASAQRWQQRWEQLPTAERRLPPSPFGTAGLGVKKRKKRRVKEELTVVGLFL